MQVSPIRTESTDQLMETDLHVLNFLDSMDAYLLLMDSLSSTLRQVKNLFDLFTHIRMYSS